MDGVQLPQGYRTTTRRHFTFYHLIPRNSLYSFAGPRKDEMLSRPWRHPVLLNMGPLDWESGALTTMPLLHYSQNFDKLAKKLQIILEKYVSSP